MFLPRRNNFRIGGCQAKTSRKIFLSSWKEMYLQRLRFWKWVLTPALKIYTHYTPQKGNLRVQTFKMTDSTKLHWNQSQGCVWVTSKHLERRWQIHSPIWWFLSALIRASGDFETSRWLLDIFTMLAPRWDIIGEIARENVQATGKVGLSVGPGRRSLVYKALKQKAFQFSAWSRFPLVLHNLAKPFPHFQALLPTEWGEGCSQLFGINA